jgi:hypothetical protein
MKPSLHIFSSWTGSIGEITKDLLPYFQSNFNVTVEGESEPQNYEGLLCHFINRSVVNDPVFKKFKKKILIQPIDGTSLTEEILDMLNQFDLIITPGEAGKQIMINEGVIVPIIVIRNFYKDNIFPTFMNTSISELPSDKIIFYHESTCHPRKGIEYLYEGFVRAFSDTEYVDKVLLVVKDNPYSNLTFNKIEQLKRETIFLQKQYKNPAQIIKISQHLNELTLKKLWQRSNIYVSFAKIEGFGIPLLRMAALQKPILTLNSPVSGYIDWLNEGNSYLIPTKLVTAEDEFMFLYNKHNTKWAIPVNINEVVKGFQTSLKDYLSNSSKLVNFEDLKEMYIDNVAEKYISVIKKTF